MPNAAYQKGYKAELNILHELKNLGYIAARSAASHSAFDVWGVRAKDAIVIQSKRGQKPSPCDYKSAVQAQVPDGVIKLVVWFPDGMAAPQVLYYNRLPDWLDGEGTGTAPRVRWFVGAQAKQICMTTETDAATGEETFTARKPPARRPRRCGKLLENALEGSLFE